MNSANYSYPKVAVLMACYNGSSFIEQQILSIIMQKCVQLEIFIQDDQSNDNTVAIVERLRSKYSNITFLGISTRNSEGAAANFFEIIKFVDMEKFDYVALSDQDDVWMEDKLERAISRLNMYNCDGYSCPTIAFWPGGKKLPLKQVKKTRKLDFLFEGAGQGCTFVLNTNTSKKVQTFLKRHPDCDKVYYHDWLIYMLVRSWDLKWHFDDVAKIYYRQHAVNDTGARIGAKALLSRASRIKSGWYTEQILHMSKISGNVMTPCPVKANFLWTLSQKRSSIRRIQLSLIIAKHGRRRFSDRCLLTLLTIFGCVLNHNASELKKDEMSKYENT